jgi:hypothetical protein
MDEDVVPMMKDQNKCLIEKKKLIFFLVNFNFGEKVCKSWKIIGV